MITPIEKYRNAIRSARQRGIEWQFTFETWMNWWGEDFEKRGSKKGQLVMARHNDTGPYHPDNVRKTTVEDNVREMRYRVGGNNRPVGTFKHSEETCQKMSNSRKGRLAWNKGLAGTGRCKAWNKGLTKQQQLAYIASKGE